MLDLHAVQKHTIDIIHEVGKLLLYYMDQPLQETVKGSPYDVVTQADKAAEEVIVRELLHAYPDHHIVGEEGGGTGAPFESAAYRWYIDPIDGTTNYANRIPWFCTSIALADAAMQPLVGVVYNPVNGELFTAVKGGGTTLNGQPIHVSQAQTLERSVIASGFPYNRATNPDNNLSEWGRMLLRVRDLRRFGSAALDLCMVASGRFDGYWEKHLNPWDCLGGALCVLEAGGTITDLTGAVDPQMYQAGRIIASNGHIHQQMLELLQG